MHMRAKRMWTGIEYGDREKKRRRQEMNGEGFGGMYKL
jgi:hypothetical protein